MPDIDGLRRRLRERGLAAAVLTSYESVSSFARTNLQTQLLVPSRLICLVVPVDGPTTLLLCNMEEREARETTIAQSVRAYVEFEQKPTAALAQLLADHGLADRPVGFELERLASGHLDALRAAAPHLDVRGADDLVAAAITIKTSTDRASLTAGAVATQKAVENAAATLVAGRTEQECLMAMQWALLQTGGRAEFAVFASGERTLITHPIAGDAALEDGALWRVDLGARFADGHLSDLARTGVVGTPSPEQEEILRVVLDAQRAAIERIEPGRPARELYRAAAQVIERAGFAMWAPHVGHGIGIGVHEHPTLDASNETPLEAGMVLNVEPFLPVPARGETYHTEDAVAVTDDGFQLLTEPQTALLRIDPAQAEVALIDEHRGRRRV
jgi:Xaa-Pro dipeptidase